MILTLSFDIVYGHLKWLRSKYTEFGSTVAGLEGNIAYVIISGSKIIHSWVSLPYANNRYSRYEGGTTTRICYSWVTVTPNKSLPGDIDSQLL